VRITGITRVRNEALIIADTIEHYLGHCDNIILYDDCSEDDTVAIAREAGGDRIQIVCGDFWVTNRPAEETRHRSLLLDLVRTGTDADWCLCFDADERLVGTLPADPAPSCDGYRLRLFDGYLTPEYQEPYATGPLADLPRMWGPEYRDILMLFRVDAARYRGLDQREPVIPYGAWTYSMVKVKHYGKCLSVEHWEETCNYYATYFPKRYKRKWEARKGKAIHKSSDFGRPLFSWADLIDTPTAWIKL
jgi:glycosyltransferase involved in cell wall biosynthesis